MRFVAVQDLRAPHARVARIFSDVRNLKRLTPPWPPLTITGETWEVRAGAVYHLEFRIGPRTLSWRSVIESVEPGRSFTDTFSGGPIRSWRHTHRFEPQGNGTRVTDEILVEAAPWARPAIRLGLTGLFAWRRAALARLATGDGD